MSGGLVAAAAFRAGFAVPFCGRAPAAAGALFPGFTAARVGGVFLTAAFLATLFLAGTFFFLAGTVLAAVCFLVAFAWFCLRDRQYLLVDDAYIAFRYAANFADGQGLV